MIADPEAGRGNSHQAHGPPGQIHPVGDDVIQDLGEGHGGDPEVDSPQLQAGISDDKPEPGGDPHRAQEAEPEGEAQLQGQERRDVGSQGKEGGLAEGGLSGEPEDHVQAHGAEGVDQGHDENMPGVSGLKDPGKKDQCENHSGEEKESSANP